MAKHTYRLLEAGVRAGFREDLEANAEFEHDFYNPDTGTNSETAVIAAGWAERTDLPAEDSKTTKTAKGGSK